MLSKNATLDSKACGAIIRCLGVLKMIFWLMVD
jgi:hypothetical protein